MRRRRTVGPPGQCFPWRLCSVLNAATSPLTLLVRRAQFELDVIGITEGEDVQP
jgi:hypothetical protein